MLRMAMLGLAAAADCIPCHAVWLKDLSLMPPVSVTMQARNLPPAAALVELAGALVVAPPPADVLELPLAGALDELLPQAASRSTADAVVAAVSNEVSLTVLLHWTKMGRTGQRFLLPAWAPLGPGSPNPKTCYPLKEKGTPPLPPPRRPHITSR